MRKLFAGLLFAGVGAALLLPANLYAKCFIFVHGHNSSNLTYQQARDYWKKDGRDMAGYIAANNNFYIVNWNSTVYYWDGAIEVAGKINNALAGGADGGGNRCAAGETSYVVVAHSMGNTVMDYILGNSRSTDPYYNYGGANFANIGNKVSVYASVQGAHRGTTAADGICGNSSWWMNAISGVVGFFMGSTCDNGTASLQTADSWQVKTYANGPKTTANLISGYEMIFGSSALLNGEDDGLLSYASTFACNGSASASYSTSNICSNSSKQEVSGFANCDQADENHDDGRNDADRDTRKAVTGGCWGSNTSGTNVRSSMSTAELIRCIWATKPAGDTSCS
jgi:hypothetical protein